MDEETITTKQVQIVLGHDHASSARAWLSRKRIKPVSRDPETGEKHWPAIAVRAALASRLRGERPKPHPEIQP